MPTPLRRAFKIGVLALATIVVAAYLYLAFTYRSADVFAPPGRIESLGRTYLISNFPPHTRQDIEERYAQGHSEQYTLERVSSVVPWRAVYQWQNDQIRGQATSSAYLKWGETYISYSLSGGP
ncbi:MAG: hypothetical protein JHC75_02650 [Rhodococcus sp.]|nr:hypothetical protein [Rhodococcus sp. (in: high G+C Gram-positive bacteria)]